MAHRYRSNLFFVLVIILGLNVLDVIFTLLVLDHQGYELNPIARSILDIYGDRFWVWKYVIVSACLLLLFLHGKYKKVETIILVIGSFYAGVILYQLFLVTCP